jgi:hypothetical protein
VPQFLEENFPSLRRGERIAHVCVCVWMDGYMVWDERPRSPNLVTVLMVRCLMKTEVVARSRGGSRVGELVGYPYIAFFRDFFPSFLLWWWWWWWW